MNKAILVIDMPECCYQCPCFSITNCKAYKTGTKVEDDRKKPEWCPLEEIPDKQTYSGIFNKIKIGERMSRMTSIEEGYYVTVDYVDSDATWGPFYKGEEKSLLKFVNMLSKALIAYPNGKHGYESYLDEVTEMREWIDISSENEKYWGKTHCINNQEILVPETRLEFDLAKDYNGIETLMTGYSVKYYDAITNSYYEVILSE